MCESLDMYESTMRSLSNGVDLDDQRRGTRVTIDSSVGVLLSLFESRAANVGEIPPCMRVYACVCDKDDGDLSLKKVSID